MGGGAGRPPRGRAGAVRALEGGGGGDGGAVDVAAAGRALAELAREGGQARGAGRVLDLLLQPDWGSTPARRGARGRLGPLVLAVLAELLAGGQEAPAAQAEARRALLLALRRHGRCRGARRCALYELVDFIRARAVDYPSSSDCHVLRGALDEGLYLWHGKLLVAEFFAHLVSPPISEKSSKEKGALWTVEELLRDLLDTHSFWVPPVPTEPAEQGALSGVMGLLCSGWSIPEKGAHAALLELLDEAPLELKKFGREIHREWKRHVSGGPFKPWPLRVLTRLLYWLEKARESENVPDRFWPEDKRMVDCIAEAFASGERIDSKLGVHIAASEYLVCAYQEGGVAESREFQMLLERLRCSTASPEKFEASEEDFARTGVALETFAAVAGSIPGTIAAEISSTFLPPLAETLHASEILHTLEIEAGTPVKSELDIYNNTFFSSDATRGRTLDVAAFVRSLPQGMKPKDLALRLSLLSSLIRCSSQMNLVVSAITQKSAVAYVVPPCMRQVLTFRGGSLVPGSVTSDDVKKAVVHCEEVELCGAAALTVMVCSLSELQCLLRNTEADSSALMSAGGTAFRIAGNLVLASSMRTVIKTLDVGAAKDGPSAAFIKFVSRQSQELLLKSVGAWCRALQLVIDGNVQHDVEATAQALRMEIWHTTFILHGAAQPPVRKDSGESHFKLLGPSLINLWGCHFVSTLELPVLGPSFFSGNPGLFRSIVGFLHRSTMPSISVSGYEGLRRCNAYAWAIVLRVLFTASTIGDKAVKQLLLGLQGVAGGERSSGSSSLSRLCHDSLRKPNDACLPPIILGVLDIVAEIPEEIEELTWTALEGLGSLCEFPQQTSALDVLRLCWPYLGCSSTPKAFEGGSVAGTGALKEQLAEYYVDMLLHLPGNTSSKLETAAKVVACFRDGRKDGGVSFRLNLGTSLGSGLPVGAAWMRRMTAQVLYSVSQLLERKQTTDEIERALSTLSEVFDAVTDEMHAPELWEAFLPALVRALEQLQGLACVPNSAGGLSVAVGSFAQRATAFLERVVKDRPYCMSSATPVMAVPAAVHHLCTVAQDLRSSLDLAPVSNKSRIHDALNILNSSLNRIAACGSAPLEQGAARAAAFDAGMAGSEPSEGVGGAELYSDLEPSEMEESGSESGLDDDAFFIQEG